MPPPATDAERLRRVGKFLASLALRPVESECHDAHLRFDRTRLWSTYGATSPAARRADFYAALTQLAEGDCHDAIQFRTSARRVHALLSRDAADWEPLFYLDTEDDIDDSTARAILAEQGYDVSTVLLDEHRIVPRARVVHDPAVPRTCTVCDETKPADEFHRRGAEGTPKHGQFASHCKDCAVDLGRRWRAANPGYDQRDRAERRTGARRRHGGPTFGGPAI